MASSNLRGIPRAAGKHAGMFVPAPEIDPEFEIAPDWRRTRDVPIIPPGQLGGTSGRARSFKYGGKVRKTGPAKLHKGERVLTAKQAKKATPAKLRAAVRKPAPRTRRL